MRRSWLFLLEATFMGKKIIFSHISALSVLSANAMKTVEWADQFTRVCSLSCLLFSPHPLQCKFHFSHATSLLALQKRTAITLSEMPLAVFCLPIYFIAILWISVWIVYLPSWKMWILRDVIFSVLFFSPLLSLSSHPSSLLLPAAPGPSCCIRPVSDSTMRHCGLPGNGTVDQRRPCTGGRERPTRYYHRPLISIRLSPSLSFLHCFLCVYCSLCLCLSYYDQCQVSLETKSLSVNRWGFTQMNGKRTMYCRQVGRCCTHQTLICCLAF